jgi:hypothetical protein
MATEIQTDSPESARACGSVTESSPVWRHAFDFRQQDMLFLFCSLMLLTCYFLPWEAGQSLWDFLSTSSSFFWPALFILYLVMPLSAAAPRVRPWFGIAAGGAGLVAFSLLSGSTDYGAQLAKLFTLAVLILSANPAMAKIGDLAMRKLNSRTAEVFTHWGTVLPGIHFSAQELYAKIEAEIRDRQWPGVEFLRIAHSEVGVLSHKREYLRVIRQRQVFDFCAATFGKDYFFTLREAEIKAEVTPATLLIFLLALGLFFHLSVNILGFIAGPGAFAILLLAGVFLLFSVLRMGLTRLDGVLMRTPVIGPVYETWFRRSTTYFQHDTRVVFLRLMDDLVKGHVDEETSAKGITSISCFEHQPILDGLYRTSERRPKAANAK